MCNIMTKKSILHYALILFFKPSARWEMIDRFSKNLQLQGKGAAPATTTYASLEAKLCRCFYCCHNNRNSQDDDLESTMRVFHFCSTYWISVKSRTYEKLQMLLCTLKIWDLKAWLEFWVYNNSRSHSPTRCSCCCGKRKWEVYTLHDGCECAHFDKSSRVVVLKTFSQKKEEPWETRQKMSFGVVKNVLLLLWRNDTSHLLKSHLLTLGIKR